MPARVVWAYIDGFNVYYGIKQGLKPAEPHLKWLDLRAFSGQFLRAGEALGEIKYFSAVVTWNQAAAGRHATYIAALRSVNVTPIVGHFKQKRVKCRAKCGGTFYKPEEKETDVAIAAHMVEDAANACFDTALLVTGDSDFGPAVEAVRRLRPGYSVRVVTPAGRYKSAELASAAGGDNHTRRAKRKHVAAALFPRVMQSPSGPITRPAEYDPPAAAMSISTP